MRISDWSSDVCSSDLLAMRRLNLEPHECVALEDSEMGLRAAASAGLAAVVTINRDTLEQDFSEAALVVSSLGEPGAPTRVLKGQLDGLPWRSEERRVGKEWVSTCRTRGSPDH